MARDRLQWVIFAVMAVVTAWTESESVWLFLLCGVGPMAGPGAAGVAPALAPRRACAVAAAPGVLVEIVWFFAKAGAFVFGSGLAIVPFLYGGVVQEYGWLNDRQFLDAVAVAMLTPGPVVITVAFIGYLVARLPGAVGGRGRRLPARATCSWSSPFRWFDRISENPQVRAFVDGRDGGRLRRHRRRVLRARPARDRRRAHPGDRRRGAGVAWRFKIPEPVLIAAGAAAGLIIVSLR